MGNKKVLAALFVAMGVASFASNAAIVSWDNSPASGSILPFGIPDTQTYGEVFTAPLTGKMTSFSLWLNGGVGSLYGGGGDMERQRIV